MLISLQKSVNNKFIFYFRIVEASQISRLRTSHEKKIFVHEDTLLGKMHFSRSLQG